MIIQQAGRIIDHLYMLGDPSTPVYLVDGDYPVIVDAGFAFMGQRYASDISRVLGNRRPAYCLLTHSHFDHCGSVSVLKSHFPEMEIIASQHAQSVLVRPHAIDLIRSLNRSSAEAVRRICKDVDASLDFAPFAVDRTLKVGDRLKVSPDRNIQVIETPGHTRDCLSFYIPEMKTLFCSEAAGVVDTTGYIISDCLVDYDLYVASMKKLELFDVNVICMAHRYVLTGQDAREHISRSLQYCDEFREWVEICLDKENGDIYRVMASIKPTEFDVKPEPKQPEPAYLLNLEARVKAVGKRKGFVWS